MKDNEEGITLVEVLATLLLLSLVTGIVWTTVSLATKFNIAESSSLHLQQEANYVIAELQRTHRKCNEYNLIISEDFIRVDNCVNEKLSNPNSFNKTISQGYKYGESINVSVAPPKEDLPLNLIITDVLNTGDKRQNRKVNINTVLSRYIEEVK